MTTSADLAIMIYDAKSGSLCDHFTRNSSVGIFASVMADVLRFRAESHAHHRMLLWRNGIVCMLCLTVCLSRPAKTAEPIEIPLRGQTRPKIVY